MRSSYLSIFQYAIVCSLVAFVFLPSVACDPENACNQQSDCEQYYTCRNRVCVREGFPCTATTASTDCTHLERCLDGHCTPLPQPDDSSVKRCTSDLDCPVPQKCDKVDSTCVECIKDEDCPGQAQCASNRCVSTTPPDKPAVKDTPPKETSSQDTPPKETPPKEDSGCTNHEACGPKMWCDYVSKQCIKLNSPCQKDSDCRGDYYCNKGTCTIGRKACPPPQTCPEGYTCQADGYCYFQKCRGPLDCTDTQICNPSTGKCSDWTNPENCVRDGCPSQFQCNTKTRLCEKRVEIPCQEDKDCKAPLATCHQNLCSSCLTDFSCPAGTNCSGETGSCIQGVPKCKEDADCVAPSGSCYKNECRSCVSHFTCEKGSCDFPSGRCIVPLSCQTDKDCPSPDGTCHNKTCTSCTNTGCTAPAQCNPTSGKCL